MSHVCVLIAAILCILPVFANVSCASPDIHITSFQVTPSSITAGQTALLEWNVSGATAVTINNGLGGQPQYGSIEVKPGQTTTYILTANNGSKSSQSAVILTVNASATSSIPSSTTTVQIPAISALDTRDLLKHLGEQVRVEGDVTYISSWLPTRFRGFGTSQPWTFMFFMKDVWEGAADNAGTGEYCPECWRDYTSQFRVIIKPENLPGLLPMLNSNFGFILQEQWLIIGATQGRLIFLPNQIWSHGFVAQAPVHVVVQGQIVNYLSAPAMYLTQPGQISLSQP